MTISPTGAVHEVGLDELFFSTTDHRGVIDQVNAVFIRLSRHRRSALIGAPHNVIRHPDMPGGAFRLIWEMLKADQPTCAYVKNLAADGSAYWTFASITPLEGGYLSVRARPCNAEAMRAMEDLYTSVRAAENKAREDGASAAAAARTGADLMLEALRDRGFEDYAAFAHLALPAEIAARGDLKPTLERPRDASGPHRLMFDAVVDIERRIGALEGDLAGMQHQADEVGDRVGHAVEIAGDLSRTLNDAGSTARALSERAPVVANAVPALSNQCGRIGATMGTVLNQLNDMRSARRQLVFSIGLARLQAEMVARYVVAVSGREEDATTSNRAIQSLTVALSNRLDGLSEALATTIANSRRTQEEIDQAAGNFARTQQLLSHWRGLIDRYGVSDELSSHMPTLDKALDDGSSELAQVARLTDSLGRAAVSFDSGAVEADLSRVLNCLKVAA